MAFRNIFLLRWHAFKEKPLNLHMYPDVSYQAALDKLNMVALWQRREKLCSY